MIFLAPKLNSQIDFFQKLHYSEEILEGADWQYSKPMSLQQAIIEGFVDGILILTAQGEWVYANAQARRIFYQLLQSTSQPNPVVQAIWHVCQTFIKSDELFFEQNITIDSEIDGNDSGSFRIRVRWLVLEGNAQPYLLVTIEDRNQSTQNLAIADAKKFGLTCRETEIWLLRRANYSYKEIAAKLHISLNTAKKHLKNIHTKQLALSQGIG